MSAALIKAINSAATQLQGRAAAKVNQSLVLRNWMVGAWIVEFEQTGRDRARYGARLLERLAGDLNKKGVKGLGVSILERCRTFFLEYPEFGKLIPYTPSTELPTAARQMNFDMNWFKARMMAEGDAPPVGILLGSDKDGAEVDFATAGMDQRLFVSRYLTAVPSAKRLRAFLESDRARFESRAPLRQSIKRLAKRTRGGS